MSRIRRFLRSNVAASATQQATQVLAGLGLQLYLASKLTKSDFGTIAFIGSVMAMAMVPAQMRISQLIARHVARNHESANLWMARGQWTTLLLAPVAALVAFTWVGLQDGRPLVMVAMAFAIVGMLFNSMMTIPDAILQGLSRLSPIAPAWIVGRVILVTATIVTVEQGYTIVGVYFGQALGPMVVLVMLYVAVRRTIGSWPLRVPFSESIALIRESVPFASAALFGAVYLLIDVILLEYLRGDEEVAVYRVASLAVIHLPILSLVLIRTLYPRMSAHHGKPLVAGEELNFTIRIMMVMSIPMAVGGMLVAEPLVTTLVDDRYADATLPMLWLLPMVPLRFVNNVTGMTMNALDLPGLRARGMAIAALSNVILNLLLIPEYGAVAAGATTLAADMFLVVYQAIAVRRVASGVNYLTAIVRVLPALTVMVAVVLATPQLHVMLRVTVAGLVYAAVIVVTGVVTRSQLGRLMRT
ncbi:MAG: O-antigen/teichoic acid export membrane protein [Myxococcota bacterium]